ncbi:hypothetical protein CXB51_002631 [Gossypium anomalum]|uniref:Uncharacterized protein n=1 Tax=Gossypium anomalum TaxID=47600 RepID=A0A8J6D6T1_9ROSI|nr:hypothetical protein CXB51_002631 [Gossypium anomalum]
MVVKSIKEKSSSFFLYFCSKGFKKPASPQQGTKGNAVSSEQKQPGGWKAMPFILGNETFERFATIGLLSNFMVYLMKKFNMDQVSASNVLNIWSGVSNFAPLIGAFISDAYVGRFATIAVASVASFLGMLTITLTAWIPQLQPPQCPAEQQLHGHCISPNKAQLGVLLTGLGLLSIGTGGIRPCSIPFGIDQRDERDQQLLQLVLHHIHIGHIAHFNPCGLYSRLSELVFVAAYNKRHLKLPAEGHEFGVFYDPPLKEYVLSKLPLTYQFRFMNKAAITTKNDLEDDGSPKKWWLCSIQDVEEVKCLIRIIPIWASGIISFTAMAQQGTFTLSQALKMNRHLGPKFQIPAGSMGVISMLTIGIFLPVYDRIMVPSLRKITKHEGGITLLQRIGIGNFFSILAMVAAGVFEQKRRNSATLHPGAAPISVFWLSPQLILMGFCEAFNILGQIEFFNKQFPEHMRSIANSLIFCSLAGSSYLSSIVVNVVHHVTGGHGHPDWLTNDINAGRLDYFYYILAVMSAFNFLYFLYVAHRYRYKGQVRIEPKSEHDVELSSIYDTHSIKCSMESEKRPAIATWHGSVGFETSQF